jgi:hypothetical protein
MDAVNQPSHYTSGGIETIDYLRAKLGPLAFLGYCIGNVLKYVSRYQFKNGLEDLKKAQVYLGWAIETMEKKNATDERTPN